MSSTKLRVPSGAPDQDSCGDTFSPTQFGLFPLVSALATFLGIIVPSLKVDDVSVRVRVAAVTCGPAADGTVGAIAATCCLLSTSILAFASATKAQPGNRTR